MHAARTHRVRFFIALAASLLGIVATSISAEAFDLGPTNEYIIVVDDSNRVETINALRSAGATIDDTYENALEGFLVAIPDALASTLRLIPHVISVEVNQPVALFMDQQNQSPTPSWGLDRVDQTTPVTSAAGYVSNFGYRSAGAGATIYVGDTGIYPHEDLAGRISNVGFTGFADGYGTVDCNGHGTHVSTTAAGTKYGIAKNATVVPVRILSCAGSGSYATVIAGLDWILSDANTNSKTQAVVSLSIGGPASLALNNAIAKLTNAGIVVVAAAGNNGADACSYSPASAPSAITVGATSISDIWASFSNSGPCVDIAAPGVGITGGWKGASNATNTISGTSMATPHVTGAVAVYRGLNPGASVDQVTAAITGQATVGAIASIPANTVNKLLYISPTDGAPLVVAPTIQLKSISSVSSSSAQVGIDVNPGNASTTALLEYSTDATFATGVTSIDLTPTAITGSEVTLLTASLESLTANTTFNVRAKATNSSGTTISTPMQFTTAQAVVTPTLVVTDATALTGYSARLNGTANANVATAINVAFQYGTDPNFVNNTITGLASPQSVSGTTTRPLTLDISNLNGNTQYYYRLMAGDSTAHFYSNVITFTTPAITGLPPIVITNKVPTVFTYPDETVTGLINPQGQATHVYFVYGTEGSLTVGQKTIDLGSNFNGYDTITVSAYIPLLTPGQGYYYRFEAANNSGITRANPFYTITSPIKPVVLNTYSTAVTQTSMTLNAQINAGASNTRIYFVYGTDPKLETGTVTAQGTPFAIANAVTTVSSLPLTGLTPGTTLYYRVKIQAYTGPLLDVGGGIMYGPITTGYTLAPTRLAQSISFTLPASRFYGGAGTTLNAVATSGLPVTYTVSTPAVCAVSTVDSQTILNYVTPISATASAVCTVSASQAGNSAYNAATTRTLSMTWNKETTRLTPTWAPAGDGFTLNVAVASLSQPSLNENLGGTTALTITSTSPKVCTIVNTNYVGSNGVHTQSLLKGVWNGLCSLQITFAGNSYWLASTLTASYTISGITTPQPGAGAGQTIVFNTLPNKEYGISNPLVARAASGLPVTFTTTTPLICSIATAPDGTVAAVAVAGLSGDGKICSITANQAGDDRWSAAAPVVRAFTWLRKSQSISFTAPSSRYYGGPATLISATSTSGLPVTFSSTTPTICSVTTQDSTTVVNYVNPIPVAVSNNCIVQASQSGNGIYYAAAAVVRSITWRKETTAIRSAWPTTVSIDGSNVDLTVSSASQPTLNEQLAGSAPLTVTSASPTVCRVVSYSYIGDPSVHTRAVVRALWNGTCILQVSFAGNSYWLPVTTSSLKSITGMTTPQPGANAPQTIIVSTPTTVPFGTNAVLVGTAASKLPVTFTSGTPAVCSVTLLDSGSWVAQSVAGLVGDNNLCTVTASQAGNESWAAAPTTSRTFKFVRKSQAITFVIPSSRYYGGAPTALNGTSTSGLALTYTTSTPAVCQIQTTDSGQVLTYTNIPSANNASCVISASQAGNETFAPAISVTRSILWMKEVTNIRATLNAPISVSGSTVDFLVASSNQPSLNEQNGGTAPIGVISKTPNICQVADVTYVGSSTSHTRAILKSIWNGTCVIGVTFAGNTYWLASANQFAYSINGMTTPQPGANAYQSLAFSQPSAIEIGGSVNLVSTASSAMPVVLTSNTPAVCSVVPNNTGTFAAVAASTAKGDSQICSITASQPGDSRWAAAAAVTRTFTINRAATGISTAFPTVTNLGAVTYVVKAGLLYASSALNIPQPGGLPIALNVTSSTPAVCSIASTGALAVSGGSVTQANVQALANGTCTITITFAGDDIRKPATRTFSMFFTGKK